MMKPPARVIGPGKRIKINEHYHIQTERLNLIECVRVKLFILQAFIKNLVFKFKKVLI